MSTFFSNTPDAIKGGGSQLGTFLHPDYSYEKCNWDLIRDCIQGERRIKEQGQVYLPSLSVTSGTTYEEYKSRATFVNMTGRTISGLVGTVFRRPVKVDGVDKSWLHDVTIDGLHFNLFCKKATIEVIGLGRIAVLVDMGSDGTDPYLCEYIAENILSWKTRTIAGRKVPSYVLLREITDNTPLLINGLDAQVDTYSQNLSARYRVLYLDDQGIYRQQMYLEKQVRDDLGVTQLVLQTAGDTITPTKGGLPFNYIPIVCIGPSQPTFDVQRSPVLDIAFLNMAHYRTSAQLEHGRFFTALPVYYIPIEGQNNQNSYEIGPSVVWEVPTGSKPGILEYFGTGLKNLADSLVEKEEHIAQLGGRIMGIAPAAAVESDNIYKMKQANELSVLLNITESMSAGMTQVLKWLLDWQRVDITEVAVRFNQDFNSLQIAARELRAIAVMYQAGILPIQEVFRVLQDSGFVDDTLSLAEFESQLANLKNFPGQPDVEAMHQGFPNAAARMQDQRSDRQMAMAESEAEMQRQHQILIDQRKAAQSSNLQEEAFDQGLTTIQWQAEQDAKAAKNQGNIDKSGATHQAALDKQAAAHQGKLDKTAAVHQTTQDIRVAKAKPVTAPAARPAKAKPAAGKASSVKVKKPARK